MGSPFLPLNKADLADDEDDNEDENHLAVHISMTSMLLVHPQVLVVPLLLLGELVPLDAVPVYRDVLMMAVAVAMTQPCHLSGVEIYIINIIPITNYVFQLPSAELRKQTEETGFTI